MKGKRNLIPRERRGLRYPTEYVAAELGVDRKRLDRACEAANFHLNGAGLKFSEAFDALTQKSESEAAIRRKRIADAESSEIDTLNKRKEFVFKKDHDAIVKDLAVTTRVKIESASYIPMESRKKLIKEVSEIKPSVVEASHK